MMLGWLYSPSFDISSSSRLKLFRSCGTFFTATTVCLSLTTILYLLITQTHRKLEPQSEFTWSTEKCFGIHCSESARSDQLDWRVTPYVVRVRSRAWHAPRTGTVQGAKGAAQAQRKIPSVIGVDVEFGSLQRLSPRDETGVRALDDIRVTV